MNSTSIRKSAATIEKHIPFSLPAMCWCLPPEVVSFAVPAARFVEMAENVAGSFLAEKSWTDLFGDKP